jgi:hypothetical protein
VCGLSAAKELESGVVEKLLQDAEQRGFEDCAKPLRLLLSGESKKLRSHKPSKAMDDDALFDRVVNGFDLSGFY